MYFSMGRECKNGSFSGEMLDYSCGGCIEAPQSEGIIPVSAQVHFFGTVVQGQLSLMLKLSYVGLHKHQLSYQ